MSVQPEGSHVHWPPGYDDISDADDASQTIHRMIGITGPSSGWSIRLPHDEYVMDEAVTLEEMRRQGAL